MKDYRRLHSYDSLGRPNLTTQLLTDGSYTDKVDFDAWGRAITQTYQRNTDTAKVFGRRYNGQGYFYRVERANLALWQIGNQDAANRPTLLSLGNGLTQTRSYNKYTGRMDNGQLATNANVLRLQEGYQYDVLGNVSNRTQYWDVAGFQEGFTYDTLNRIETSTVQGQTPQTYTYDAGGNLTSKSNVGNGGAYSYPTQGATAIQPHAVQSIAGVVGSFVYDANGNMTSGAGRTITWNSFDMPVMIRKGSLISGNYSSFVYGPEHQRTRQNKGATGYILYAGPQEVETTGAITTIKTYWPGGIGVEIDRGTAQTELRWTHLDRLGSVVAISDQDGILKEKLAYDAWGKRRNLSDSGTPDTIDGVVDNKGYTGHEMLDQLDLVHMNGRVYDPLTAKFLSADPHITDPVNGQNYNRYSYGLNNPTNFTDPSGFDACPPNEPNSGCGHGSTLLGASDLSNFPGGGMGGRGQRVPVRPAIEKFAAAAFVRSTALLGPRLAPVAIPIMVKTFISLPGIAKVAAVGLVYVGYKIWMANESNTEPTDALAGEAANSGDDKKTPNANDPAQPNENNLDKLPENKGNRAAQDAGYESAHDAKDGRGDSKVNIYNDKKTGQKWLWDGKKGSEKEIL